MRSDERAISLAMSPMRILTIEDDPDIAHLLQLDLTDAGYEVLHAGDGMTGLTLARQERPAVVLLDLGLPDFDGAEVLKRLRRTSTVPIIVLTARDTVEEKVRLLGLGADDYVIKPFHPDELIARIQVQLRQKEGEVLAVGPLTLDPQKRLAYHQDNELLLSPTEFNILEALMQQPGRVVSRKELADTVWQGRLNEGSNVVDVHIANLRGKLRDVDAFRLVRTVRGVGYAIRT